MRVSIPAISWDRLVTAVSRLKPSEVTLSASDSELVLSAVHPPIALTIRIPADVHEPGSTKLPRGAISGIGPGTVSLTSAESRFTARSGNRVIRSALIAGTPLDPVTVPDEGADVIPVGTLIQALAMNRVARAVEKGSHSRDAAPFQVLSVNSVRTVSGQPGGSATAIGPGVPGLETIHFPIGSASTVTGLLTGIKSIRIRSIGSRLIISGDGLTISVALQSKEITPLDQPVDATFFDPFRGHASFTGSLKLADATNLSKICSEPVLWRDGELVSLDESFQGPAPEGWPPGCFDPVNLVRCASAVADSTETLEATGSSRFVLLQGSRGVVVILGRAEGL